MVITAIIWQRIGIDACSGHLRLYFTVWCALWLIAITNLATFTR